MNWFGVCVLYVVAAALWLCDLSRETLGVASNNNSTCIEPSLQCFDAEYPECADNVTDIIDQPIQGIYRTARWCTSLCYVTSVLYLSVHAYAHAVLIGSRQGSLLDSDDFSQLLTELVCHHLNRSTTPPLCWVFSQLSTNVTAECNRYATTPS